MMQNIFSSLLSAVLSALTLFRMSFFGAAHGWGGGKALLLKICHTYPTMMKLSTVTPYLKKIEKLYESRDTPLEFFWHQHFFTGSQQILQYQEIQIYIPFRYIISNSSNFSWVIKKCLNERGHNFDDVSKMATPDLHKILKIFWKKGYDVIIFVHDATNKFCPLIQIIM